MTRRISSRCSRRVRGEKNDAVQAVPFFPVPFFPEPCSRLSLAAWWNDPKSAASIIATNAALPDPLSRDFDQNVLWFLILARTAAEACPPSITANPKPRPWGRLRSPLNPKLSSLGLHDPPKPPTFIADGGFGRHTAFNAQYVSQASP